MYQNQVSKIRDQNGDITTIFYNLQYSNPLNISVPAQLNAKLNASLVDKCDEWDVAIVRFSVPNYNTPLFYMTDGQFQMSMSYGVNTVTLPVVYNSALSGLTDGSVWEIQVFVQMLNTTLISLWTQLNALSPLPSAVIPYFTYSEVNQLFSLTVDQATYQSYGSGAPATPIILGINDALLTKIQGFPIVKTATNYQFLILNTHNNVVGSTLVMTTQSFPFDNFIDFQGISITTNMNTINEQTGSSGGYPVLQDFIIGDSTINFYNDRIVYTAETPYRQSHLLTTEPLNKLTANIYWMDVNNQSHQILIGPHQSVSIKFMLTRHDRNRYY